MINIERHGLCWELFPDCQELLDRLIADPGRTVKQTPTKLVTVHQVDGRTFYVKRYLNTRKPMRRLKYVVMPSKAKHEWRLAQQFATLDIPLVRHLAFGERRSASGLQESILVTEAFDGVELSNSSLHQTVEVQVALAIFLRHMHDQGVLQRDLHHNILVRVNPIELRRVDLGNARIKSTVTENERIDNLAWFDVNVHLSDAFFETYGASLEFVRETRRRSAVMRRESREKNSWRCLRHGLYFAPKRFGGLSWWVRKEFFDDNLQRVLEHADHSTDEFFVQQFTTCRSARRAYRTAYHLELLGVPTPRPIAAGNQYFVTERIAGAISFAEHLGSVERIEDALLRRLAVLLAQLHDEGFASVAHLSARDFLVNAGDEVWVVPANKLRFQREVNAVTGEADMHALTKAIAKHPGMARADMDAFFQSYRGSRRVLRSALAQSDSGYSTSQSTRKPRVSGMSPGSSPSRSTDLML